MRRRIFYILLFCVFLSQSGFGQILSKNAYRLAEPISGRILGNGIGDMVVDGRTLWVATGEGISKTTDLGDTWVQVSKANGMGKGSVSAIAVSGNAVWAATVFDTVTDAGTFQAGGGVGYSTNNGATWKWVRQPVDAKTETRYKPIPTNVQNTTWDIAIVPGRTDTTVWIASFGGGIRKTSDNGKSWEVVTVDGLPFNALEHLTHRAFSLHYDGESLWAGTAGGVHKSTDGGETWVTFSHQNQKQGISGNFITALVVPKNGARNTVWAATVETTVESKDSTEFSSVSKSEDGGLTWTTLIPDVFPHNFAFDDSVTYVATDMGLYKIIDLENNAALFPRIVDRERGGITVYSTGANSAAVGSDHALWVGTNDGLGLTRDNGINWRVFRGFKTPGEKGEPKTYAYPNPFSPLRDNLLGDDGHVRFQYRMIKSGRVTVRVYDFGMNLVTTVVKDKERPQAGDYAEVWNGRNDAGDMVANGVYFYKVEISGEGAEWGKILVVN